MKIQKANPQTKQAIKYPRNQLVRKSFQLIGRILTKALTNTEINGMENYPKSGRLIVVGNHTGVMETVLMTSYAHRPIEYMGSVDIPHEPQLAFFMNAYKFIPVFRGNVSTSAMKSGLEVLEQEGVIGIFPEGGIWEPAIKRAQSGVAWLSHRGNSPVLPIGFSATAGLMSEALSMKRPYIKMKIGRLIPAIRLNSDHPKKFQYEEYAQKIMAAIWSLLPEEDLAVQEEIQNEKFDLDIQLVDINGNLIPIPDYLKVLDGASFSKILYRSTLINNFRDNLNLNIEPLKSLNKNPSSEEICDATGQILNYLETQNPYYFTYRYKQREGNQMQHGIQQIHDLACWAARNQLNLRLKPIRTYTKTSTSKIVTETHPTELRKW